MKFKIGDKVELLPNENLDKLWWNMTAIVKEVREITVDVAPSGAPAYIKTKGFLVKKQFVRKLD